MPDYVTQPFSDYVQQTANAVVEAKFAPTSGAPATTIRAELEKVAYKLDASALAAAASATSLDDADQILTLNAEAGNVLRRLTWTNLKTAIRDFLADLLVPTGAVSAFAMAAAPNGWLPANGATVSRTTYAALFDKIGTTYGAGNGSTTFRLPDLRGEFIRGVDDGRGVDAGRVLGTLQSGEIASHGHTGSAVSGGAHAHTGSAVSGGAHTHTGSTSSDGNHNHGVDLPGITGTFVNAQGFGSPVVGLSAVTQGTSTNGAHSHSVSIDSGGAHSHSLSVDSGGAHTHTLTIANTGGAETRPRNVAMLYCIKI